jgi:hypothetical protein
MINKSFQCITVLYNKFAKKVFSFCYPILQMLINALSCHALLHIMQLSE